MASLLAFPLITEATTLFMQSVGFDFFLAGNPDKSVEAVEVEAFVVGTAAKKDGILDCRRAFWIAFAMSDFVDLEEGHNFRGSSFLAKSSSSSFDLLRSSSSLPLSDMLSVSARFQAVLKLKFLPLPYSSHQVNNTCSFRYTTKGVSSCMVLWRCRGESFLFEESKSTRFVSAYPYASCR